MPMRRGWAPALPLAEFAATRGLPCGAPVRTGDGALSVSLPAGVLALLRHVPGKPPDLSAPDQVRRAGRVLARAHQILLGGPGAGQDALIDWATPLRGPLLYDLASFAVLTRAAGPAAARWFAEGYAEEMPEIGPQLEYLHPLVQARWVAQAIYFAARIEHGIDRGPGGPGANEAGLAAAYQGLTG